MIVLLEEIIKPNHVLASCFIAVVTCASAMSQAASISLNSPIVGPNQPGTFYVTGTVSVGAGESVLSPNLVSTVALPFLSTFTAGFNSNCGNFDSDFLNWNGTSPYSGKVLDFTVNSGNLGFSGGMPLGLYNTNPLFPGGHSGISLDYLDTQGVEHSMLANYAITVAATPEPATLAVLSMGAVALIRKRKRA